MSLADGAAGVGRRGYGDDVRMIDPEMFNASIRACQPAVTTAVKSFVANCHELVSKR